ncbi:MAG: PKD domain-containing protein [Chitinophagales bacterium]|nr:PKD domain-containing protein [Chitinophagales bacterium]
MKYIFPLFRFWKLSVFVLLLFFRSEVFGQITCNFTVQQTQGCAPLIILATANETSSSPVTLRQWTLTGPPGFTPIVTSVALNQNFSYAANMPGNYCLKLWAQNFNGDTCSYTNCNLLVAAKPTVNFTFAPVEGCSPLNIEAFCNSTAGTGTIDTVRIEWGCGGTPYVGIGCPATPIPKTYLGVPGCCSPTVIIRNSFGCYADSTYHNKVCLIPKPVANFAASVTTVNCATAPLTTTLTADSAGPNMTYTWYVNNTMVQTGSSRNLTYTFAVDPNCYDIALKVQHPSSAVCSDSLFRQGYICNRPQPTISFTQNSPTACIRPGVPFTLVLTNTSPGLPSMSWSLAGGSPPQSFTPQQGNTASYSITTTGTYTVTATANFGVGCSASVTQQVLTANQKPTAFFTADDTFACSLPYTVNFTSAPCSGCTYQWSFQSGTPSTSSLANPSVTYNNFFPNGRNVTLIVTSPNGCRDTLTRLGYIKSRAVVPVIGMTKVKGCAPVCVTFSNNANLTLIPDTIASVCWSFPNGTVLGACQDTIQRCFADTGCNTVTLTVTTTTGCVGTTTLVDTICVGTPPVCTATATPQSMCYQQDSVVIQLNCVPFTYAVVNWGDGSPLQTTYNSTVSHIYQLTGTMNTTVSTYQDSCVGDIFTFPITVLGPIASFKDSTSCTSGTTVYLVNQSTDATSYNWNICGTTSTLTNPVINSLPACDSCFITLTATNSVTGCVNNTDKKVIAPCQSAGFIPTDTIGCAPFTVRFMNTSLTKDPTFTRWDFNCVPLNWTGAGTGGGDTINRNFTVPGTFCIAMRNRSNNGCIDTVYGTVQVCKVTANFSPTSVCYPLPINFTDLSVDTTCGIDTWEWNFGDGTYSGNQNPTHNYANPGQYQVKLKVSNVAGCRDSITKTVTVAPVNVNYTIDTIICPGKQGCVTNNSTGVNLTYNWNIPGALPQSVFTNASPCYSFANPGDYPAYIHISSAGQCDFYDTVVIHNRFPEAGGHVSTNYISCPNPPVIIQYYDSSKYADSTWLWNFGDNAVSIFDTANHIYSIPGCYAVTLTVTTKDGCSNTTFIDSICVDGPYGDFGFSPPGMCACKDTITFTVSTINSSALTLLYGCNQGFTQVNPVTPIGTSTNPTILSFPISYCITDTCQPQLVFGDTAGCVVYMNGNYAHIDSPVVNFTFNNYGVCVNGTVCFQDATTYALPSNISFTVKRIWDFGDGQIDSTSNNPAPCHYYAQPGGYNTKLYIHSNYGCFDSIVSLVVVVPEFPIAGFYADDSLVCANSPLCFHDTSWIYPLTGADYWVVDFGDGSIDTFKTKDFCHAYTTGGYYRVAMCVYDSVGCPDCDSSVVIRVIDNPIANAGGDKFVCNGIVTQLNGSGGTTPQWEPAAIFSNPNSYNPTVQLFNDANITFIVGDQYGCRDTDYATLTVAQVFADFTLGATFCEKEPVCVTDASTGVNGTVSDWLYDFSDGTTQHGPDTCHSFLISGTIPITLIATDNHGCKDTVTKTTAILPSPDAAFSLNDTVICSDQTLCATDLSTTSSSVITNWYWNFGGVYSSTNPTPPCYLFTPPYSSVYDVSLIVVDQSTCRDTAVIQVTLNEVPYANFNWSTSCESDLMPLSSTSQPGDGAIIGCEWLLWMGAPNPVISTNCNTSFQFPAGSYPVRLVVTDVYGCTDTMIKTVVADSISELVIYPGDTTICEGNSVAYNVSGVFDNITWTPNVWISDPYASTVLISPLANISYIISATNGVCTAASDTFSIRVLQQVPIEVMATPEQIVLGLTSNITTQIGAPIDSIVWFPDATLDCRACPNPIARPTQTTTYTATIYFSESGHTCLNTQSVTIEVLKVCDNTIVFVPNTFTPNGDGLNDVFMIRGLAATRINNFRVFDRWGKMVFEAVNGVPNDPQWGWHGTDRSGEQLNSAVYVYTYEIECINGDIVKGKGNVTLLR